MRRYAGNKGWNRGVSIRSKKGGAGEFPDSLKGRLIYSNPARRRRFDRTRHKLTVWGCETWRSTGEQRNRRT
jgi:hypothetical protein